MNKNITLFICSLSSGGAEHQITELGRLLIKRGYQVRLVTFADAEDFYSYPTEILRIRLAQGCSTWRKFLSIFRYFITTKSDCVISFGQRENLLCLLPLLFRRKIKVINGERNFTKGRASILENVLHKCLYRRSDAIVPNSYSQRNYIVEHNAKLANKVFVITNYTDINKYTTAPQPNNEIVKIGIFGRYTAQKNCIRFAEAVSRLKQKVSSKFIIEWYGNQTYKTNQPNEEYIAFANKVKELNIEECLHLYDHTHDVTALMPNFDAIALPSLWEGFSNSISEAICCGKPMLVSDVSDNSVMVKDGINGFLFNPLDVEDICNAFEKFFNTSFEQRNKMGIKSRKIAEELFSAEKFVNQYINLIEN